MSEPFLGEIRLWAIPFAPFGWATCDGQIIPVAQNCALFALLGTMYGGDGAKTFGLPDLRGRVLLHRSTTDNTYQQGVKYAGGSETVTFSDVTNLPVHSHALAAVNSAGSSNVPSANRLAGTSSAAMPCYTATRPVTALAAAAVSPSGASSPQENMQPSQVINYCIAVQGYFPSRP